MSTLVNSRTKRVKYFIDEQYLIFNFQDSERIKIGAEKKNVY